MHWPEVLFSVSTFNTVAWWVVLGLYLSFRTGIKGRPDYWPRLGIIVHATAFWTYNLVARLTLDYVGPSWLVSTWGGILFLHIAITLFGVAIVDRTLEKHRDR